MAREKYKTAPISPLYSQSRANESIELGMTRVQLVEKDVQTDVAARFAIVFEPREKLQIYIPESDSSKSFRRALAGHEEADHMKLRITPSDSTVGIFYDGQFEEGDVYQPDRSPIQIERSKNTIVKAIFHAFNWPDLSGPDDYVLSIGTPPLEGGRVCGRFNCEAGGWLIQIVEMDNADNLTKELREKDGYAITHVGEIHRSDGQSFSAEALNELMTCLHYFFSFAFGRWTGPQLTVGLDKSGDRVVENWGLGRLSRGRWNAGISWMDSRHSELLGQVFPGFYARWASEIWRKSLRESLYWYINAGQVGHGVNVDSALLFTQAALELLAWTYCVKDRKMLSENAFKQRGLSAADKLRVLASTLGIPLDIPVEMKSLHSKRGAKWKDSFDAITTLRNGLVHPSDDREVPKGSYVDAWKLSMWYLDLVLLRLCSHSGKYANRCARRYEGQVEDVPWTSAMSM